MRITPWFRRIIGWFSKIFSSPERLALAAIKFVGRKARACTRLVMMMTDGACSVMRGVSLKPPSLSRNRNAMPSAAALWRAPRRVKPLLASRALAEAIAKDFLIEEIRIGTRSQLSAARGGVPAHLFLSPAIGEELHLEALTPDVDFEIRVRYVGTDPNGSMFYAALLGENERGRCVLPIHSERVMAA